MATYTLISSNVLTTSAASVTFSSIPATYTDLVVRWSSRETTAGAFFGSTNLRFNAVATNYSRTWLWGTGAAASSGRQANANSGLLTDEGYGVSAGNTSNTFSSNEVYLPSYTVSQNKPLSLIYAGENNTTTAYLQPLAGLWSNTASVTSITLTSSSTFASGSSFYLYGISNA
jgi:hypothetical protein